MVMASIKYSRWPYPAGPLARDLHAAPLARHLNANQRALQRHRCAAPVDIRITRSGSETLFRAFPGLLGSPDVDFFRTLGGFREHRHAITQNLREPAEDRETARFTPALAPIGHFADTQLGNERRVPGKNAETPVGAGEGNLQDRIAEQMPLPRH